jgi:hypothetical protein
MLAKMCEGTETLYTVSGNVNCTTCMKVFQKLKIDPVHHQAIPFLSNEEV